MLSRRDLLRAAAASAAAMVARPAAAGKAPRPVVAPFLDRASAPGLGLWTRHAAPDARLDLPARVHAVTLRPDKRAVVAVARRPGRFGVAVDLASFERSAAFEASPDRHFFGHGVYSGDGRLFLTTENDTGAPRGLIGVRDVGAGYRHRAEWRTGGVGPHDLALSADGRAVLVANGGIDMSQDTGRAKLNEGVIASSIARIDLASGRLDELTTLAADDASLSIRHLAPLPGGAVAFGCQETVRDGVTRPLVGVLGLDGTTRWLSPPAGGWEAFAGYVGAVAADETGRTVAATAPLAGLCVVWHAATGIVLGTVSLADCCGIGGLGDGFVVTSGRGEMVDLGGGAGTSLLRAGIGFDNHLAVV